MKPFVRLDSVAAPLPEANIDTDIIFPARFLLIMEKKGLGKHLFHERSAGKAQGSERFVLNEPPFDKAQILVTGPNFGVGSSREHAVWALADFGISCVIAPSFGEIFFGNCFKNGVLPIVLSPEEIDLAMAAARSGKPLAVDLEEQQVVLPDGRVLKFEVDPYRRRSLLLGLDEIGGILADDDAEIAQFEARQREATPWLYLTPDQLAFFNDVVNSEE